MAHKGRLHHPHRIAFAPDFHFSPISRTRWNTGHGDGFAQRWREGTAGDFALADAGYLDQLMGAQYAALLQNQTYQFRQISLMTLRF